jgi:hypothetical protein
MIGATESHARRPSLLFVENGAWPSAGELVEPFESDAMSVLEVGEPTAQHPVEVGHDAREILAPRAPRLLPDAFLELGQTLLTHMTLACLAARAYSPYGQASRGRFTTIGVEVLRTTTHRNDWVFDGLISM